MLAQNAKHRVKVRSLVLLTLGVKRAVRGGNAFKALLAIGDFASNTEIIRLVFENERVATRAQRFVSVLANHRSWRAWRSRLKVMGLASQPNPTPLQRFTPRSPASQAPSGE